MTIVWMMVGVSGSQISKMAATKPELVSIATRVDKKNPSLTAATKLKSKPRNA